MTTFPLRAGDNVLAVEVQQASGGSSDISFDVELIVTEITGTPSMIDSVAFGSQVTDVSYGRDPVLPSVWSFFVEAASDITTSLESGFYAGTQTVVLTGDEPGETIRYTLDGSIPSTGSALYANELAVDTTISVVFVEMIPGNTVSVPGTKVAVRVCASARVISMVGSVLPLLQPAPTGDTIRLAPGPMTS